MLWMTSVKPDWKCGSEFCGLRDGLEDFRQVVSILLRKNARRRAGRTIDVRRGSIPMLAQDQESYSAAPVALLQRVRSARSRQDAVDAVATNFWLLIISTRKSDKSNTLF